LPWEFWANQRTELSTPQNINGVMKKQKKESKKSSLNFVISDFYCTFAASTQNSM
jgi:hypothetical protein